MPPIDRYPGLRPWLEKRLGHALEPVYFQTDKLPQGQTASQGCAVLPGPPVDEIPLLAYRTGSTSVMRVPENWIGRFRPAVAALALDELFSVFGAYELSRLTLDDGVGVWGPSWYYFAERDSFAPGDSAEAIELGPAELRAVDPEVFWHCDCANAVAGFGVFEDERLVALSTVRNLGAPVYEIDIDVAPASGRRGLGRTVMGAAGRWIFERDGLPLARTAPWNVPSARLLRSLGMRYALCDMVGTPGPFLVPPQPLGTPTPDTRPYNLYPDWAMNRSIGPKQP